MMLFCAIFLGMVRLIVHGIAPGKLFLLSLHAFQLHVA